MLLPLLVAQTLWALTDGGMEGRREAERTHTRKKGKEKKKALSRRGNTLV